VPKKVMTQRAESADARPVVRITLREQNKIDKFARIRAAAAELFSTKGFDNTSVREIADSDGARIVSNEVFRPGYDGWAIPGYSMRTATLALLERHGFDAALLDRADGWWER